jgi:hypothetical protein
VLHRDFGNEDLETIFGAAPDRDGGIGKVVTRRSFVGEAYDKRESL